MHILTIALVAAASSMVFGDTRTERAKLVPDNGASGDRFGEALSISNGMVLVGATGFAQPEDEAGAAYLFDARTGLQLARIVANDPARRDRFGETVALNGNTALIAATQDDDGGDNAGSVYVFDISDASIPVQLTKILSSDIEAGDLFGTSIAMSGEVAVIGAVHDDDNGIGSGSAYVFDISDAANPVEIAKLLPDDGMELDAFGSSVGIWGDLVVVGAWGADSFAGAAYLFNAGSGQQLVRLRQSDPDGFEFFGITVAINDSVAIVGSPLDDGGVGSGSVYLFDLDDGSQVARLLPDDAEASQNFGTAVSLNGNRAIVGAPFDDESASGAGAGYLFDIADPANPIQLVKLLASDAVDEDRIGQCVQVEGSDAVISAWNRNEVGNNSGAAYLFSTVFSCPADLDGDSDADADDFFFYLDAFAAGDAGICDTDGDGDCEADDFFAYLDLFILPCE